LIQHQHTKIAGAPGSATDNTDVLRDCMRAVINIARLDEANENSQEEDEHGIQFSKIWQMVFPLSNAVINQGSDSIVILLVHKPDSVQL
jgi:hypothetical protein